MRVCFIRSDGTICGGTGFRCRHASERQLYGKGHPGRSEVSGVTMERLRVYPMEMSSTSMQDVYARRQARDWPSRLYRALKPPDPFLRNPAEPLHFPLGRWNLYVGGGGSEPEGYVNIDLFALPGVDVA